MQPPGTPPFSYAYDHEEFIPIKCNIHPWMRVISSFSKPATSPSLVKMASFSLPDLPPGHYTITAWHETYGTQNKEITVGPGESVSLDFTFTARP